MHLQGMYISAHLPLWKGSRDVCQSSGRFETSTCLRDAKSTQASQKIKDYRTRQHSQKERVSPQDRIGYLGQAAPEQAQQTSSCVCLRLRCCTKKHQLPLLTIAGNSASASLLSERTWCSSGQDKRKRNCSGKSKLAGPCRASERSFSMTHKPTLHPRTTLSELCPFLMWRRHESGHTLLKMSALNRLASCQRRLCMPQLAACLQQH